MPKPAFWNNEKPYYDLKSYWQNLFGCRVHKLPIDAGFTCPNRDGTLGRGGCTYCDGRGSALRRSGPLPSVTEQIRRGQEFYRQNAKAARFVAYFQTFTNTYGPVDHLRRLYDEALAQPDVVGLAIGTRPDCLPDDVLDLLKGYARRCHLWLELGLQSIHDRTLAAVNRGHSADAFLHAVEKTSGSGILLCVHIIVGLPGESYEDTMQTAETLAGLPLAGIKIHCLLALAGTPLGEGFRRREVNLPSREEYVRTVCDILEILPPEMVIQRLVADGYQDIFLGPDWAKNKLALLGAIERELQRRGTWQGARYRSTEHSKDSGN